MVVGSDDKEWELIITCCIPVLPELEMLCINLCHLTVKALGNSASLASAEKSGSSLQIRGWFIGSSLRATCQPDRRDQSVHRLVSPLVQSHTNNTVKS